MVSANKKRDLLRLVLFAGILILLNLIASMRFFRLDLTAEKRYSLSPATIKLLEGFEDVLLVQVYLEGDFPASFQRLQTETRQLLNEMRAYNPQLQYRFVDPSEHESEKDREDFYQQLQFKGLKPYELSINEQGGSSKRTIFPGALLNLGGSEVPALLLRDQLGVSPERQINASIENLEFTIANAIRSLTVTEKPYIGFLQGHEELGPRELADFARELGKNYRVDLFDIRKFESDSSGESLSIRQQQIRLNRFDALVIAKPRRPFTDLDKYLIDQFVMNGGKTIWLLDAVQAEMDSLSQRSQFMSLPLLDRLKINDLLFKYGARVNTNLVTDLMAAGVNDQERIRPWIYFPLVMPREKHPIVKDLNAIWFQFASTLDSVRAPGVSKRYLLYSSPYTAVQPTPHLVSLAQYYQPPPEQRFRQGPQPVAMLLEGEFSSLYTNRVRPRENGEPLRLREKSRTTQMLVVGDGDIARNQFNLVNPNIPKGAPLPLGYDQYTGQTYGNKDFLLNTVDYMLDESGLISLRSRELKIRLLDTQRLKAERWFWQALNALVPVLLVFAFALINSLWRRRKYGRK